MVRTHGDAAFDSDGAVGVAGVCVFDEEPFTLRMPTPTARPSSAENVRSSHTGSRTCVAPRTLTQTMRTASTVAIGQLRVAMPQACHTMLGMTTPTPPMSIVLVDLTTDITPANLRPTPTYLDDLIAALNEQIQGPFASEYGPQPVTLRRASSPTDRAPTEYGMNYRDTLDVQGALAYHTVVGGVPDIEIGCDLFSTLGTTYTVGDEPLSQGAGHELLELLGDVGANLWEDMGTGIMRPREECDTVQNTGYTASNGLWMTNFLLRSAWIPQAAGPWDYLGLMKSQDDYSNGYEVQAAPPTTETQVGGLAAPRRLGESVGHMLGSVYIVGSLTEMQRKRKASPFSRTYRRGARL